MFGNNPFGTSPITTKAADKPKKNFDLELSLNLTKDQKSGMRDGQAWKTERTLFFFPDNNYAFEEKWLSPQQKRGGNGKWSRHAAIYDHPLFQGEDIIFNRYMELEGKKKQFKYGTPEYKEWGSKAYQWKYRKLLAVEVMDFTFYHKVEASNGYTTPLPCEGSRCPFCNDKNPDVSKKHFGGRRIMLLSENEFKVLQQTNAELGTIVGRANDDSIIGKQANPGVVGLNCENCNSPLMDPEQVKRTPMATLDTFLTSPATCSNCGHNGMPVEVAMHGDELIERGSIRNHAVEVTKSGVLGKGAASQFAVNWKAVPAKSCEQMLADLGIDEFDAVIGNHVSDPVDIVKHYAPEGVDPTYYGFDESLPADQQPNFRVDDYKAEVLRRRRESIGGTDEQQQQNQQQGGGFSFYRT